jgi:hypothetical protein
MYPFPVLEMLAKEHQRDMIAWAAHERAVRTLDGHQGNWWKPLLTSLRHAVLPVESRWHTRNAKQTIV